MDKIYFRLGYFEEYKVLLLNIENNSSILATGLEFNDFRNILYIPWHQGWQSSVRNWTSAEQTEIFRCRLVSSYDFKD